MTIDFVFLFPVAAAIVGGFAAFDPRLLALGPDHKALEKP